MVNKSQKINSNLGMLESKKRKLNNKFKDNQIMPIMEKEEIAPKVEEKDDFELNELYTILKQ